MYILILKKVYFYSQDSDSKTFKKFLLTVPAAAVVGRTPEVDDVNPLYGGGVVGHEPGPVAEL